MIEERSKVASNMDHTSKSVTEIDRDDSTSRSKAKKASASSSSSNRSTKSKSFKNVKHIDEVRTSASADEGRTMDYKSHGLGRFWGRRIQHSHEVVSDDALNRSEHDEISRPWHHNQHRPRSFRHVKYVDEEEEAWQTRSVGSGGGIDHVTDHYSDSGSSYRNNKLDRSGRHIVQPRHPRQHETMLEVMMRLQDEEESSKLQDEEDDDDAIGAVPSRRSHHHHEFTKKQGNTRSSRSMLEAMEQLMGGKDSIKFEGVAERSSAAGPSKKSTKALPPALSKPTVANCA